jgi:hypothetical protein
MADAAGSENTLGALPKSERAEEELSRRAREGERLPVARGPVVEEDEREIGHADR